MNSKVRSPLAHVLALPVPECPRCGNSASETHTQYGLRAQCCGLWSWNRKPLVDAGTHDARRELVPLMQQVVKLLGPNKAYKILRHKTKINNVGTIPVSEMNEATCRKVRVAVEDLVMDIMAGEVKG